jgi:taurine dioxygenase
VVIPEVGGDTVWANTVNAYETLSPELRELADTLRIVHTNVHPDTRIDGGRAESHPGVGRERPAVRVDGLPRRAPGRSRASRDGQARTAARRLRARVVGYPSELSRSVIARSKKRDASREHRCGGIGAPATSRSGTNRSTQHCAIVDYGDAHRRCERVTIAGETPVGVDGRPGVSLRGDASTFYAGAA